ncbi:MAG: transposase family protein [Clostridiales bacterium]|jgi:hypothetical protein|nr:transposase family protein [Clostridiales bacterium]MDR2751623.1 transposase family protein [Clostridiales bacterium]
MSVVDKNLFVDTLNIERPAFISSIEFVDSQQVVINVNFEEGCVVCPICGAKTPNAGYVKKRWRHLDCMQFKSVIVADMPVAKCSRCGELICEAPWARQGSPYTAEFELMLVGMKTSALLSSIANIVDEPESLLDEVLQSYEITDESFYRRSVAR